MPETMPWWQSRIIWMQIAAAIFTILSAFHVLPKWFGQEQVDAAIMISVAVATTIMRMRSTHAIAKPDLTKAGPLVAIALMLGLPLSGCVTTAGRASASAAIERVDAAYARIRIGAELALPLLPPEHAARVRLAIVIADRALAAARTASDVAEQLAQMRAVEREAASIADASLTVPLVDQPSH